MSTAYALVPLLALVAALAPTAWLVHRHSEHRHAHHRLHRPYPYTDRIRPLIATRRSR